jgi:UDP-2,3-diacylglucosamine pyrophosphatase LpxH
MYLWGMTTIHLQPNKKIYFASDFHLGYPDHQTSLKRERKVVAWLDSIKTDAQIVFLVGDIFDFWFEYKNVVPKGFVRLLGKLAELTDAGIEIIIFTGNHDIWMFDYFTKEMNIKVYRDFQEYEVRVESPAFRVENSNSGIFPTLNSELSTLNSELSTLNSELSTLNSELSTLNSELFTLNSELSTLNSELSTLNSQLSTLNSKLFTFYIVHGDGLGPGDYGYKFLKKVFESKLAQWAFSWLHPHIGIGLANFWSGSRKDVERIKKELQFRGDGEWLWSFAKEQEALKHRDFYVFGHRHLLLDLPMGEKSRYINLGQWAYDDENSNHFAVFDGVEFIVKKYI